MDRKHEMEGQRFKVENEDNHYTADENVKHAVNIILH